MRPDISVVVCTRNRAEMLRDALVSLTTLATDGQFTYEVLVVDNGSTDATPEVVLEIAQAAPVTVRRVLETRAGIVPARNRGVVEAAGEWIAFFDDDQLADPRWLAELFGAARENGARCVGGAVALKLPAGSTRSLAPICRLLLSETSDSDPAGWYSRRANPGTGNVLIERTVFDELGGFSEAIHDRGEDTELYRRMVAAGIPAWYTPHAIIHHVINEDRLEDKYLLNIAERMGAGLAVLEQRDWGWLYPAWWLARIGQCVAVVLPQRIWAALAGDEESRLGSRCRLTLAQSYIAAGSRLLFTAPPAYDRPVLPSPLGGEGPGVRGAVASPSFSASIAVPAR